MFSSEFCKICKNFSFRILLVAASWLSDLKKAYQMPFGNLGIGIDIVISLPFEALIFTFRSFLWSKTSMVKSFSYTLASFPGIVWCYSAEKSLAPASEERNSAMDVISGVLKTRKAESCSLYVCVFLIRNHIRDHFLEVFCKFQSTIKKFG